MKKFRNPPNVHTPLAAYSHQVEVGFSERLLILSGQVGIKKDGTIPDDPVDQMKVALENIKHNLDAAGMNKEDIIKLTIYAVDHLDADKRRKILADYFKDFNPCMTLLFVSALGAPSLKVEIDTMASSQS